ncbi:MAG: serine/threonine-protein kinase [Microcoleaceae cyanobacterium]
MVEKVLKKRYVFQKLLGKNAGRRTVLARDLETQQLVVVKILTFDPGCQWDDLKLFEREAETLQSLSHPAIPRYLDHFEFEAENTTGFALVQSYIEARSLEDWVNLGRTFNEIELKQLAESLLEILIYLHSQNPPVIHRDLKPSNILLTNRSGNSIGQVYLVDFGSVQTLVRTEGSTMTVVGTYGYMPPEQFGGRAVPATDLYSLGATLIYLATGKHPADLPQEDLRIQFKPKHYLSPGFRDWLNWLIEPSLNHRIDSAKNAAKALEKINHQNNFSPKLVKSESSYIKLNKTENSLEIIIHHGLWTGNILQQLIGLIMMLVGVALLLYLPFIGVISVLANDYSTHFFGFIIALCITFITLSFIFQSTILKIDSKKISLTRRLLGVIPYRVQSPSLQQHICQIKLLHYQKHYSSHNDIKYIQIWAGTQEYKLPTWFLTKQGIDSLAFELSSYLNLPITY